jgi:NAD(P)-dependent dehydrogenase (short-subunit alcohol dehydrogenase family)
MAFDLTGRTALVTGAGQGMGRSIAMTLADHGASVLVNDLHADRAAAVAAEIASAGGNALAYRADVTDRVAVQQMVKAAEEELAPVDILVNNAGNPDGWREYKQFRAMTEDEWEPFIRLDFYAVLHCARAVIDGMCERGWGRIITIASEAGRYGVRGAGVSIYGGAKAGAIGFLRHLAMEVNEFGVTVNCVSPGLVGGPGFERSGWLDASKQRVLGSLRLGLPEDIAPAVLYFASDEASWVTGQVLPVNGGSRNG